MKKPILHILLLIAALLPVIFSCNDEDTYDEKRKRLGGTWQCIWSEGWDRTGAEEVTWGGPSTGPYWTLDEKSGTGNDHDREDGLGENYDWLYENDFLIKYNLATGYREEFYIEKLSPATMIVTQDGDDGNYFCRMEFTKIAKLY